MTSAAIVRAKNVSTDFKDSVRKTKQAEIVQNAATSAISGARKQLGDMKAVLQNLQRQKREAARPKGDTVSEAILNELRLSRVQRDLAEIRNTPDGSSRVRSLLQESVRSGDGTILHALEASLTTDFAPSLLKEARQEYEDRVSPDVVDQINNLETVLSNAESNVFMLEKHIASECRSVGVEIAGIKLDTLEPEDLSYETLMARMEKPQDDPEAEAAKEEIWKQIHG